MNTTDIIAIGFFIATGIFIFWGIKSWWPKLMTPKAKASPPVTTTAGTTLASITTPPPSPAPSPSAPAPAYLPRNWNWLWWLAVIALLAGLGWWAMKNLSSTAVLPQPSPPKKTLQKQMDYPLEFLGGKNLIRGLGWVKIQKGGYATFRVASLPIMKDGKYEVILHTARKTTGRDCLLINAGKENGGAPFFYETHPASDHPVEIAFFRQGMAGNVKYFYPTENFFQLSADDNLLVWLDQPPYVKITYWE